MDNLSLDQDYRQFLADLKGKIRKSQFKAAVQVNETLLRLYWDMGRDITERQKNAKWGSRFLFQLSNDLHAAFPDMKGFSLRNLKYIRLFYQFYGTACLTQQTDDPVSQGTCRLVPSGLLQIGQQPVAQLPDAIFHIPWGHHIVLMTKCKSLQEAFFYIQKTLDGNWSRSVLLNMLDTGLYEADGKAVTNFAKTLPLPQGDLAQQTLKDPYVFDFLTMRDKFDERDLEDALVKNITRFLLELGTGFAYVGHQVRIEVGDQEFFMDLLFYHLKLRCYVVIELKTTPFQPENLGQLGFYVTAVNEQLKHPSDTETIGLLICKEKNKVVAEYALKGAAQPLGISEYRLSRLLPDEIKSCLPTIEEIESELSDNKTD
ncbi:MAG: DUF1016 family protein [Lentisphaeria bacterium]|nr:DUF1016 family protein [Lentisphaeria bacterium]